MKTPYDILGVPRNADHAAVRAALRKAAKASHPDLNGGDPAAEQTFKQVIVAYETLRDPQKRAAYDELYRRRRRRSSRLSAATAFVAAGLVSAGILTLLVWQLGTTQTAQPGRHDPQAKQPIPVISLSLAKAAPDDRNTMVADPGGEAQTPAAGAAVRPNSPAAAPEQPFRPASEATAPQGKELPQALPMANIAVKERGQAKQEQAAETAPQPPPTLSPSDAERAERLLARGEKQMGEGNVGAARLFFQAAAEMGLAAAALRLGETYDAFELYRVKAYGVDPAPALARRWYERARALGATEAEERLARLDRS
jgi:curved DNA-binding protein CbpA